MKAVINRVRSARIEVNGKVIAKMNLGLLVYLGITHSDTLKIADKLVKKLTNLRVFEDENHKMNLSIKDVKGEFMIISQFTLYGDTKNNNRPSFTLAAKPDLAMPIYQHIIDELGKEFKVSSGEFGAHMQVFLENDGPVNILIEMDDN